MTSELDVFGLIGLAMIGAPERNKFEPHEFFGREQDVKAIQDNPLGALKLILEREWPDVKWDGAKGTLSMAAVVRLLEICNRDRGMAHLETKERKVCAARKILENHKANGGVSLAVVKEAESVIASAGKEEQAA